MRKGWRIAIIMPALNEAPNLYDVLARVPDWIDRVCVVDNGSTDGTAEIARRCGALVLTEERRGYGWACSAGIAACTNIDIIVFADADGSDDLALTDQLVDPIAFDEADLVLGNRLAGFADPGAMSWPQRWGNRFACWLIWLRFRHRFQDLGPFRALRRSTLVGLDLRQMTFGWTAEMQVRICARQMRAIEIPVGYRCRNAGRSKVSRSFVGIAQAGFHIIRTILKERPS